MKPLNFPDKVRPNKFVEPQSATQRGTAYVIGCLIGFLLLAGFIMDCLEFAP